MIITQEPEDTSTGAIKPALPMPQGSSPAEPHEQPTFYVEPDRLEYGAWDHALDKHVGQGDIAASYSADRIACDQPIRTPFIWEGAWWVSVGSSGRGRIEQAQAYRLINPRLFVGASATYAEKTKNCEAARHDPNGCYHGMRIKRKGETLILCGPPAIFRPGEKRQLGLFDF